MRWNRCVALSLFAFGMVAVPGAAPQQRSVQAASPTPAVVAPPLPTGPAPDLDLVFTAEVAGYVEPCG